MLGSDELVRIWEEFDVPLKKRELLKHDFKLWEALLNDRNPEETEIFLEKQGSIGYLFSENILMKIDRQDSEPRNIITFFPLNEIKSCNLQINGFESNNNGEVVLNKKGQIIPDTKIQLFFCIGKNEFTFNSDQLYTDRLISILTNKILPKIGK
ncbi:MAG: hypothetical protein WC647_17330 [Desulfomonilaceae bacterium]|jgi:hypothetical protein